MSDLTEQVGELGVAAAAAILGAASCFLVARAVDQTYSRSVATMNLRGVSAGPSPRRATTLARSLFHLAVARPVARGCSVCALALMAACVEWQRVPLGRAQEVELPRWVRVTLRDSTELLLERARFNGDTLVGRARRDSVETDVHVPAADIARLEARLPSLSRSAGIAALLLGSLVAILVAINQSLT